MITVQNIFVICCKLISYKHSLKTQTGERTVDVTRSLVHWSNRWLSWFNCDRKPLNLINN
jgi:hypothetical protein